MCLKVHQMRRTYNQTRPRNVKPPQETAQSHLDYRIPSHHCGPGRMSRFAMRTTDIGRSGGTQSFLHSVYVRDMAHTRIPGQVAQLVSMPTVIIRRNAEDPRVKPEETAEKCTRFTVDCCDGINAFSVAKVTSGAGKAAHKWGDNMLWYHDMVAVRVYHPIMTFMADIHSPPGNIIGHIDRTDTGLRLLDSQEKVILRLKRESASKFPLKCLHGSPKERFEVDDDHSEGRYGTLHYKGSNHTSIKVRFGSNLQHVERVLMIGLAVTLVGKTPVTI